MQPLDRSDRQSRDVLDLGGHGFVLPRFARKPVRFVRRLVDGGVSMRPRSAVAMALAALVTGGGWWLAESGRAAPVLAQATAFAGLRIASVDVSGNEEVSKIDVVANIDLGPYRSLFSLDVHQVRESLKRLAWVHDVKVVKSYPDRLLIEISERQPVALWQEEKNLWLVDRSGAVIVPFDDRFTGLPLLVGKGANEKGAEILVLARRYPRLLAMTAAFVRVGDRRWNLRIKDGPTVLLPEGREAVALERLAWLDREKQLLARDITHVDLRSQERLVIGLNEQAAKTLDEAVEARAKAAAKARAVSLEQQI